MANMSKRAMSMEAALEEDRLEIMTLLEGSRPKTESRSHRGSTASSTDADVAVSTSRIPRSPRSPIRSVVELSGNDALEAISPYSPGLHAARSKSPHPVRSMLDTDTRFTQGITAFSPPMSPIETTPRVTFHGGLHPRSQSDASTRPPSFGPRPHGDKVKGGRNDGYLLPDPLPIIAGGLKSPKIQSGMSMAEAIRGELSGYGLSGLKTTRHSIAGTLAETSRSKSPAHRLPLRSKSPVGILKRPQQHLSLDNGSEIDKDTAFRRLSDAELARSGGSLSGVPKKGRRRAGSDILPLGPVRSEKDDFQDSENAFEESSDEDGSRSSDEESRRGRRKGSIDDNGKMASYKLTDATAEDPDEDDAVQESQRVKSLLEPEITVTGPGGDRLKNSKPGVHPMTAFDQEASGRNPTVDSDTEADISDIKRAQKLAVIMTPIVNQPKSKRCVRTIYRGDFGKMSREAEDNSRRVRKYLVATDLSEEAAHALEWTIGTVLRDGDTLLCIYCVDEEIGIGEATEGAEGTMAAQAESLASIANGPPPTSMPSPKAAPVGQSVLSGGPSRAGSPAPSPMGRGGGFRAEAERHKAVEDITTRVSRLLRKTRLQVRVVIEVIHCKSPRHLICEVIDYLSPTLVILGSRGRSALKGVILGSFSNYLVTKSSVPVMVARKKLRKHTKYKRPPIRLANNLTNVSGRSLAAAKID